LNYVLTKGHVILMTALWECESTEPHFVLCDNSLTGTKCGIGAAGEEGINSSSWFEFLKKKF
jgi:hypothetical protein